MLKKKKESDMHEDNRAASPETGEEAAEGNQAGEGRSMEEEITGNERSSGEIPAEDVTGNEHLSGETPAEELSGKEIPAEEIPIEEKLKKEIDDLNDKYLRLYAEFDNFKRRSVKERMELIGTASKSVILSLLPVLDDFDRAQKSMETAADTSAVKEGVDLISTKFRSILAQQGVKEMEAIGQPFDADLHEAVTSIPAPSEDMKGKVVDQLEKGYYLNDKVIRFAKVLVGA